MKSFLTACGVNGPLQLTVERQSENAVELRQLHQPFAVIGRGPRVDVVLDDPRVSRRHVYLQFVEGRAFWVDLESRSGTNGDRKSQKFGWLEGEQALSAGPYVIRRIVNGRRAAFTPGGLPSNTPLVTLAYGDAPPTEVALEFLNGPSQSTSRPVHRVMSLIGSARGCKFRLTDPSVSRFHGSLLRLSTGLWIVDLLGHRGIIVNEVPVRFSRLNDGDVLRIGRYQIRVRCRLRGHESGTGLPDRSRATHAVRFLRQDNDANGLKFPDWGAAAPALGRSPASLPAHTAPSFPNAQLIPTNISVPGNLAQSELTESMLVPLVNQFGVMQQQMFDQFQQAMAMMVQMFGTMHRDQMEVIRSELDQLRELTEEFQSLKIELANRSRAEIASGRLAVDPTAAMEASVSAAAPEAATSKSSNDLGVAPAGPSPVIPTSPLKSNTLGQRPFQEPRSSPTSAPSVSATASVTAEQSHGPTLSSPTRASVAGNAANSDRDTVVWLHQRIMSLQRERESRWQKILKLLPGMS